MAIQVFNTSIISLANIEIQLHNLKKRIKQNTVSTCASGEIESDKPHKISGYFRWYFPQNNPCQEYNESLLTM